MLKFPLAVKLVVIDLDGTLVDTAADIAEATNLMLRDLGQPERDPATVASWIGNGVARLVKRALTGEMDGEPDPQHYALAYALFLKHYEANLTRQSRPFPGVVEGLEWLQGQDLRLVCITNKAERFTRPLLEVLGLHKYFALVLSGDSLPRQKPDPLPLVHACRHFGLAPAQALLVGDSGNDVRAARAAGMPVICVDYGYNHGRDIRTEQPDAVIGSLTELPLYLRPAA